ncbi:BQ5605_C007g04834 [Microbotryum silenes-dioicae]|uniref:BQ5605_C007g04834 protein n=1 Tax=Microbotryum silenes-dioicae TaxID=796604 RepID=A0A2X0MC78_9BASI|nr:BQ5605_C007g04834 [Microbotryum silenes-dioicae]
MPDCTEAVTARLAMDCRDLSRVACTCFLTVRWSRMSFGVSCLAAVATPTPAEAARRGLRGGHDYGDLLQCGWAMTKIGESVK